MRLIFITQDFPPEVGGIQTYSWEIGRRLAKHLPNLHLIAPDHPHASEFDQKAPFPITRVSGRSDLLPLTALQAVIKQSWKMRPTVAFHAQWQTVGTSILAQRLTGWPQKIVCAAHGRELLFNPFSEKLGLHLIYNQFRNWIMSHVDSFFPVSQYTADLLNTLRIPNRRLHVISNGTDPDYFKPDSGDVVRHRMNLGDRPILLTLGRLVARKGIDTVLRALPSITDTIPDIAYLVVGTGPDRERLEHLARRLDVSESVYFLGQIAHRELPAHYSAADLFVMPARESLPNVEGFGLVFLEANACGTPVIGAHTGGIPDAIIDGQTGVLVPPSDPTELTSAITRLLTDSKRLNSLAQQGRSRILETANWNHVTNTLLTYLYALT